MFIVTGSNQGNSNQKSVQQTSGTFASQEEAISWAKAQAQKNLQYRYTVYTATHEVHVELPEPVVKIFSV